MLVLLISNGHDKFLFFTMQIFFFPTSQVKSGIYPQERQNYLIGIYRGTVLLQSFLFYCYHQHCSDTEYLFCSLLPLHTHEILQDVNLCLNKNSIYINKGGGKQEASLVLPRVFFSCLYRIWYLLHFQHLFGFSLVVRE